MTKRISELPVKAVLVSPHRFSLVFDAAFATATSNTGTCMEDEERILLDPDLSPSILMETILHEVLHAIWHQTELDRAYADEQEEQVVWTLAPRLLALLRDNPKLVEALCK